MAEQDDSSQGGWDPASDPDGISLDDVIAKDWILDVFLDVVLGIDDEGSGFAGLTIQSNGVTVSGIAISRREYMERLVDQLRPNMGDIGTDLIAKVLEDARDYTVEMRKRREGQGLPMPSRSYIHMRDVRLFSGAQSLDVPLWRGSLKDISGWSLGSHNPKETK